jgi:hypothetical protein
MDVSLDFDIEPPGAVKKMTFTPGSEGSFKEFSVQYNPTTLGLSRSVGIEETSVPNYNWEKPHFKSGKNDSLTFQLLLDQSEVRGDDDETMAENVNPFTGGLSIGGVSLSGFGEPDTNDKTISAQIKQLYALTMAHTHTDGDQSSFHTDSIGVSWGDFAFFGFITSLKVDIILFDSDGNPRRATVDVEMKGRYWVGSAKEYTDLMTRAETKSSDVSAETGND